MESKVINPRKSGPPLILIADDDEPVRRILADILVNEGYEVLLAKDGKDAFNIIKEKQGSIDLVLLDIKMPKMDGVDLLGKLEKTLHHPIGIIMITGLGSTCRSFLQCGHSIYILKYDYLAKPFPINELLKTVSEALVRVEERREEINILLSIMERNN